MRESTFQGNFFLSKEHLSKNVSYNRKLKQKQLLFNYYLLKL
ncbi:hypothetical protein FHS90_003262 [Rufibacter quisquiliarum]|uniref:Uncharacterized protein n=1 Tax=Rufibacter quisquiliarum TaxID=1549639 RepID=A0A839GFV2_9BACT|nr:hypothetical protein [Rufibacter quisquiliarum]